MFETHYELNQPAQPMTPLRALLLTISEQGWGHLRAVQCKKGVRVRGRWKTVKNQHYNTVEYGEEEVVYEGPLPDTED